MDSSIREKPPFDLLCGHRRPMINLKKKKNAATFRTDNQPIHIFTTENITIIHVTIFLQFSCTSLCNTGINRIYKWEKVSYKQSLAENGYDPFVTGK